MKRSLLSTVACTVLLGAWTAAENKLPDAKPVPYMQAIPLPRDEIAIRLDGRELTRFYAGGEDARRAFWYPIRCRTSDVSLTRMGHPHDPVTHSHHNSVWISHHDLEGIDFWGDHGKDKGRILHVKTKRLWDSKKRAGAETEHAWVKDVGGTVLLETRRWEWVNFGAATGGMLSIEIEAVPPADKPTVTFGKTPFGLIGVRMAKSIGVHDGGGRIMNSAGAINEKAVFRKPARWVDYTGRIDPHLGAGGITLMDHPSNPGHPNAFHVRDDGWMGICLTLDGALEVSKEKPLKRRYALWVHDGVASQEEAEAVWRRFADSPAPGTGLD